jgi:hypothetical protein
MEVYYIEQLAAGGDNTQTMKAYMGLSLLQLAKVHISTDTSMADIEPIIVSIEDNLGNVIYLIETDLVPIFSAESQGEFFDLLISFFEEEIYPDFRDSITVYFQNIGNNLQDVGTEILNLTGDIETNLDHFSAYWDSVRSETADFEFSFTIVGTEYEDTVFVFSRTFFDRLDKLSVLGENTVATLDSGFTQVIDSVNSNSTAIDPGIAVVQEGLDSLNALIDSLQVFLSEQPFAPFELDIGGSGFSANTSG